MDNNLFSTRNIRKRLESAMSNPVQDENEIKHLKLMYSDSINANNDVKDCEMKENNQECEYIATSELPKKEELRPISVSQSTNQTMDWSQHKDKIAKLINERKVMIHDDIVETKETKE